MKVMMWVGSPKPPGSSTSEALLRQLGRELEDRGAQVTYAWARHGIKAESLQRWVEEAEASDVVVLGSPVYFDSLPYPVTACLEGWYEQTVGRQGGRPRFAAVINCGFPEAAHCELALDICRQFCRESGLTWWGGFAIGGGGVYDGKPLDQMGHAADGARMALGLIAEALVDDAAPPVEAANLLAKGVLPKWLYIASGTFGWTWAALREGALLHMADRPYAPAPEAPGATEESPEPIQG